MTNQLFDHEKLVVYQTARKLLRCCYLLTADVKGRAGWILKDQILRAVISVLVNIAEGAGEYMPGEKARIYRLARRSGDEVSACLDGLVTVDQLTEAQTAEAKSVAREVVATLVKMIRGQETRAQAKVH